MNPRAASYLCLSVYLAAAVALAHARDEVIPIASLDRTTLQGPAQTVALLIPALAPGVVALNRRLRVDLVWEAQTRNMPEGSVWNYSVSYTLSSEGNSTSLSVFDRAPSAVHYAQATHALGATPVSISINSAGDNVPAGGWAPQETTIVSTPDGIRLAVYLEQVVTTVNAPAKVSGVTFSGGTLGWNAIAGVEEYEVEWVYIDQYDSFAGNPGFDRKKGVRIGTPLISHEVGTTYPEGIVVARVRAVSRHVVDDTASPGQRRLEGRRAGDWSTHATLKVGKGPAETKPFEQTKNWRYLATYAEEGRRKESLTYYDGTLRSRQTLTSLGDATLITETKYDFMGRPAMEILPAAVEGRDLQYRLSFNRLENGKAIAAAAFDGLPPPKLSACNGAAFYYGKTPDSCPDPTPTLPPADGFRGLVPDSEGFPYSLSEYLREGAGLPRSRSGVGQELLDHRTTFHYGGVDSYRLRKLFGSNAANARNFQLNVTKDPNGQGRASYLDKAGRLVATSLIGEKPPALQPIRSYDDMVRLAPKKQVVMLWRDGATPPGSLDSGNDIDTVTGTSKMVKTIANLAGRSYTFSYEFGGTDYTAPAQSIGDTGQSFPAMCVSCSYELTIRIQGPDGKLVSLCDLPNGTNCAPTLLRTFDGNQASCGQPRPAQTVQFSAFLDPGEFRVIKELKIRSGTEDQAVELMTAGKGTIRGQLVDNGRAAADLGHCATGCEASCEQDYPVGSTELSTCKQNCAAIPAIAVLGAELNQCSSLREAMKADVSPWGYLFEDAHWLSANWPAPEAIEIWGVILPLDDSSFPPYPGSPAAATAIWRSSWANVLVTSHPEYRHYQRCKALAASNEYDGFMMQAQTWAAARSAGLLNPLQLNPTPGLSPTVAGLADPYFDAVIGKGKERRSQMKEAILAYTLRFADCEPGTAKSLWEFVADPAIYPNGAAPDQETQWRMFRGIYLGLKEGFEYEIRDSILHIPYLDTSEAHVKRPLSTMSWDDIQALSAGAGDQIYAQFCPWKAAQWTNQLVASCSLTQATADAIKPNLEAYCRSEATASGPFVQLSQAAVAGSPILQDVAAQLPASCGLDSTFSSLPTEAKCQNGCCQHDLVGKCVGAMFTAFPYAMNSELAYGCLPWPAIARITTAGIKIAAKNKVSTRCAITVVDVGGQPIDLSQILAVVEVLAARSDAPVSAPAGMRYTGLTLVAKLAGEPQLVKLYVFSSCQNSFLETTTEACRAPEIAQLCKPASTLAAGWRNLLGTPAGRDRLASKLLGKDETGKSCEPKKQASDCMRAALLRLTSKSEKDDPWSGKCDCGYTFFKDGPQEIDVASIVKVVGGPVAAAKPFDAGNGMYTGFKVLLELSGGKAVWGFIFSTCQENLRQACVAVPSFPFAQPLVPDSQQCIDDAKDRTAADIAFRLRHDFADATEQIYKRHVGNCMQGALVEKFTYESSDLEHHFVAYYHDQSGNLVQTVPPEGVREAIIGADGQTIATEPSHRLLSRFKYNSRNQVTWQATPDAGDRLMIYDEIGQLRFSQNSEQGLPTSTGLTKYSYTKYDNVGRRVEIGVIAGMPSDFATLLVPENLAVRGFPFDPSDSASIGGTPTYELSERTRTYYDTLDPTYHCAEVGQTADTCNATVPLAACATLSAGNLRGRVAAIAQERTRQDGVREHSVTCYSYDPHGHVVSVLQSIPGLGVKRLDYEFGAIAGDIRRARYQAGQVDEFQQSYVYDGDRRLVESRSSFDGMVWHRDALYAYYKHGPQARVILGEKRAQGLDYVYTLQGWLKSVNSDTLKPERDAGSDGIAFTATSGIELKSQLASAVAQDVFGLAYHYFPGDYTSIGSSKGFISQTYTDAPTFAPSSFTRDACPDSVAKESCGLYDGTIGAFVVANRMFMTSPSASPLGSAYRYDQLKRMVRSKTHRTLDATTSKWPSIEADRSFSMEVSYDGNGNIQSLQRFGDGVGLQYEVDYQMDALSYCYDADSSCGGSSPNSDLRTNRLLHINDDSGANLESIYSSRYDTDIDDQGDLSPTDPTSHNYAYDRVGNLISDRSAGVSRIAWTNAGRIARIDQGNGSAQRSIVFAYDGLQERIAKASTDSAGTTTTYLVRDAIGRVIAFYEQESNSPSFDVHYVLHGAPNRIGVLARRGAKAGAQVIGSRTFEATDHAGSVLAVISDRIKHIFAGGSLSSYGAQQQLGIDYYPFGMPIRSEFRDDGANYRFGFNGALRDDLQAWGDRYSTSARAYDARIGRWWSVDPEVTFNESPYAALNNNPINRIDPDGRSAFDWMRAKLGRKWIETAQRDVLEWAARKSGRDVLRRGIQRITSAELDDLLRRGGASASGKGVKEMEELFTEAAQRRMTRYSQTIEVAETIAELGAAQGIGLGPEAALLKGVMMGVAAFKTIRKHINLKKFLGGGMTLIVALAADDALAKQGFESMTISERGITLTKAPTPTPLIDLKDPSTYFGPLLGTLLSTGQDIRTEYHISPDGHVTKTYGGAMYDLGKVDIDSVVTGAKPIEDKPR